jgi:hypothetical protein
MSASAPIACAADTWVKVASGVTSTVIWMLNVRPSLYKQTYVDAGGAAPTDDSNAVVAFGSCDSQIFSAAASSDVYIKAVKYDGSVRVDL